MKKVILFLISFQAFCQIDTIKTPIFTSVFDKSKKQPLYVEYYLYRGGGDCNRAKLKFTGDSNTLSDKDYQKSGFDRGHLANAEDFAAFCQHQKMTFSYYNVIPQTHNLNAGKWSTDEDELRILSQKQPLKVICGGIYLGQTFKNLHIPTYCFKIVFYGEDIIFCKLYSNYTSNNWSVNTSIENIERKSGYKFK